MSSPEAKLRSAGIEHPALDPGIDRDKTAGYVAAVQRAMSMPEQEFLSFIPERPMVAYCECPRCYGGVEGNSIFTWTIDRPEEMVCRFCNTIFPNADYPEDQELSGVNALGETVTYRYHLKKEKNVPHFLSANLDRWRRTWLVDQCVALGRAYRATGDESFAARAILVLDRIAELYPHYPVIQNGPRRIRFQDSQEPPYPWDSGKWGYFHDEIPRDLILTYDMVYDSPSFDSLSTDRGYDVRARIENDWFRPTYVALTMQDRHVNNVIGYDVRSAALLGRVLGEPRYVHWAFGWMRECVEAGFFVDGMWHESPAYHQMTVGGLESAFASVVGYTDPTGYVDPVDGTRFDDLDPEKEIPFWARCRNAPHRIDFPNGCTSTVHDTHPHQRRGQPSESTRSVILPAYGHASLGRGSDENQMQAQFHFSGGYGHSHRDNLNLTLWAHGREILPDLGYTWTQLRYWTSCTLGHNTVVVDRQDQLATESDGDLIWFFPDVAGVSVVEADGRRGYRDIESMARYRRMVVLVPVSERDAYVVDLFRVTGGSTHDWALHGDADEDTEAACSVPLGEPRANMLESGEEWVEPTIEGAVFNPYGLLRDMRSGSATDAFHVDFAYADRRDQGVRVHLLGCDPGSVWLGNSPSVRRMGTGSEGDMRKAYDFWMPMLLVRREAAAPLA
ncbi:MAG: heparinase II/III family protein, partial [Candidatus Latescibacteria bacterium]|nr:heparinase II/III family protein [Candidatus Latescibacterota bacterium]